MPLYEVELRGETTENRLTDHRLDVGQTLRIGSRHWMVVEAAAARDAARELRFICVEARFDSLTPQLST
jgi:hypothetical protein